MGFLDLLETNLSSECNPEHKFSFHHSSLEYNTRQASFKNLGQKTSVPQWGTNVTQLRLNVTTQIQKTFKSTLEEVWKHNLHFSGVMSVRNHFCRIPIFTFTNLNNVTPSKGRA